MHLRAALLLAVSVSMSAPAFAQPDCGFNPWMRYKDSKLLSHPTASAYLFASTHMSVDADGAPNAYHPDDTGLDYLANAGYPNASWWRHVLVPDRSDPGRAHRQTTGAFAGYFVSKTSLEDRSKAETDPARYVDARTVPYLVFPGSFYRMKGTGRLGDLGYAVNVATGDKTAFVVADIGPSKARLGEVSIALAQGLGGKNVSPRTGAGAPRGKMLYVVFPYSSRDHPWPLGVEEIERQAEGLLGKAGGIDAVLACENAASPD